MRYPYVKQNEGMYMKKRRGAMKYVRIIICILTMSAMLCGCSFKLNRWYFLDGGDGWKELLGIDGSEEENASEALQEEASEQKKSPWGKVDGGNIPVDYTFDEFMELMFLDAVSSDTLTLHFYLTDPESYGILPGPVTLGSLEAADAEANTMAIEACRQQLNKYSLEELDREQRITLDLMNAYLDICQQDMEFEYYYEPLKPGMGIHASLPYTLAEYTFYDKQDVEDYLELLTLLEEYFQSVVRWEQERAGQGLFMPDSNLDTVLEECEAYLWDGHSSFFLQESFEERLETLGDITGEEKQAYAEQNEKILTGEFAQAYRSLMNGMEELRGRGTNEEGVCYFPRGQEYYEYLVASNIGMTYESMDALCDALEQEISMLYEELERLLYSADAGVWEEWMTPAEESRTPEELLNKLEECIQEDFPALSQSSYQIKIVPKSLEEVMNPAFYMIPPIDSFDQNAIYINEAKLKDGGYNLFSVLAHEGYPGHLYQNMYFNSMEHANIRKILQFTGYSEGWGTYAEYYSFQWMEEHSDTVNMLERLTSQLNMALSAYLDLGINYYGWDRESAAFFCEQAFGYDPQDQEMINELFNYMISDPTGYLDYYVGYLEIRDMAEEARQELGISYDAKEFHRFLLEFGPAPFTVIEPYFEEWLAEQDRSIEAYAQNR